MREMPGIAGALYVYAEWLMRFSAANILWFIVNLPLLFVLFSVYVNGFAEGFVWYLLPLAGLFPAVLVPSTIALFATVREWVIQKDQPSITKAYLSHAKANYLNSFFSGIYIMGLWLVWLMDFYFLKAEHELFGLLFAFIGLFLFVYTLNFFSLSVHYDMKQRALMKNAFYLTIGNPLLSLFILASNLAIFYVSAAKLLFLLPLFAISISAYLSFLAFYRVALKMQRKIAA
ncbi:DUF624 domain-containing protein [Planomicrobium chinense]|uniref:YesL family protein n=1 Tax=Planococcus chinensis TaxID=272917 RepID=UPI001CC752DE|nr:DUF624 domain-containing protein [Planococcus chinensis]MBZ5202677.1 DUF624 domain-containing protein [Planococcus chinensis]